MMLSFVERLAAEVKKHRKEAGLSQKALADYAQVGKTAVFDIEHAKKSVQLITIIQVLNVLNISLELSSPLIDVGKDNASS